MQVFELLGKKVQVNTDQIATGLTDIYPDIYIGFGIFNAELMTYTEEGIRKKVNANFDEFDQDLFKGFIEDFVSECMKDITVKLMKQSTQTV